MKSRLFQIAALIAIAATLVFLFWRAVVDTSATARLDQSRQKLKRIGLALHEYHDKYEQFPPAYVLGPDGKPWHSWRVLVLPFLNENSLYERYRFDEPWDGPNNRQLHALRPDVFGSPLQNSYDGRVTTYQAVVSRRSMWPAHFSVPLSDVLDGTSSTIFLVENDQSEAIWMEPRELTERDVLSMLRPTDDGKTGHDAQRIPVLMVDGSVRVISARINRDLFVGLLTPKFGQFMVADGWPRNAQTASQIPEVRDISNYAATTFLPTPYAQFSPGDSVLSCATVQLAWDKLRPAAGEPVNVVNASEVSDQMNRHPFPPGSLDENSYFAGSQRFESGKNEPVAEFRRRFPSAPVELAPVKHTDGLRILAYLQKSMPFIDVLERLPDALRFRGQDSSTAVQAFGWTPSKGAAAMTPVLTQTVRVASYSSPDEFIVVLRTDSGAKDEIILAMIAPEKTLHQTWATVESKIQQATAGASSDLHVIDDLQIPVLSFGLRTELPQLKGLGVPTDAIPLRWIEDAVQTLRFRIDEYGAELVADTQMIVSDDEPPDSGTRPVESRKLIFNRPFFMAIQQQSASAPYFLAWIGNADLMEPANE